MSSTPLPFDSFSLRWLKKKGMLKIESAVNYWWNIPSRQSPTSARFTFSVCHIWGERGKIFVRHEISAACEHLVKIFRGTLHKVIADYRNPGMHTHLQVLSLSSRFRDLQSASEFLQAHRHVSGSWTNNLLLLSEHVLQQGSHWVLRREREREKGRGWDGGDYCYHYKDLKHETSHTHASTMPTQTLGKRRVWSTPVRSCERSVCRKAEAGCGHAAASSDDARKHKQTLTYAIAFTHAREKRTGIKVTVQENTACLFIASCRVESSVHTDSTKIHQTSQRFVPIIS